MADVKPAPDVQALGRGALGGRKPPRPLPPPPELAEDRVHRLKNRLLGRPLHTDQLVHERLGKPTALAVFECSVVLEDAASA